METPMVWLGKLGSAAAGKRKATGTTALAGNRGKARLAGRGPGLGPARRLNLIFAFGEHFLDNHGNPAKLAIGHGLVRNADDLSFVAYGAGHFHKFMPVPVPKEGVVFFFFVFQINLPVRSTSPVSGSFLPVGQR
jgi:hypothetical protein